MKTKSGTLISGNIKGISWHVRCVVYENGTFCEKGTRFGFVDRKEYENKPITIEKQKIRKSDRLWVYRNIPSSIHWCTEIHHNWLHGGIMYLLTKGEHILHERVIRRGNPVE